MSAARPRYPRYGRFIGTGVAVGGLAAAVLATATARTPDYDRSQLFLYLLMLLGLVGGLLGGAVAVALERGQVKAGPRARRGRTPGDPP